MIYRDKERGLLGVDRCTPNDSVRDYLSSRYFVKKHKNKLQYRYIKKINKISCVSFLLNQ